MRELSTVQQSAWIERVFAKFSAMYGRTFSDLWDGVPAFDVKAEWRGALAPFSGSQIAWAIEACGKEFDIAPTLPRFVKLCLEAPRPLVKSLPAPDSEGVEDVKSKARAWLDSRGLIKATPGETMKACAQFRAKLAGEIGSSKPNRDWALRIITDEADGKDVPAYALRMAREALNARAEA